jgi:2-amino-4-hydroxy-6-hydroxymethyldihydropteridine diphosphokinase
MTEAQLVRAALGLGSNLGDREMHLRDAVQRLRSTAGVDVVAVSPLVETDPVGGPDQPDYLNAVVVIETVLPPEGVLELAQECEEASERVRTERWGPRTLDVDVLAYGEVAMSDDRLTVPHPRALQRAFVLVPWAAVDPEFVVEGRTVAQWTTAVGSAGVRWFEEGSG